MTFFLFDAKTNLFVEVVNDTKSRILAIFRQKWVRKTPDPLKPVSIVAINSLRIAYLKTVCIFVRIWPKYAGISKHGSKGAELKIKMYK